MHAEDIRKSKKLIANGSVREAFEFVINRMQELNAPLPDEILLLHSQFNSLRKKQSLNLTDGQVELNNITYGFLQVLNQLQSDQFHGVTPEQPVQLQQKPSLINKAQHLYIYHQELITQFKLVHQQISRLLEANPSGSKDSDLANSLEDLLTLKDWIDQLKHLVQRKAAEGGDPDVISQAQAKINYVEEQMTLSEIPLQIVQIKNLIKLVNRSSWTERIPLIVMIAIILILTTIIGLKLFWL